MAHNLTINALGKAEMFYVGESPWHGLGTRLENVATSQEALTAAYLNWTVECRPIYLGNGTPIPGHWATVRTDTAEPLGVVGNLYTPIQNEEAFAFLDALLGEAAAMYHTAGSLRGGRKVWALAKLPQDLVVVPEDVVNKFLLLLNSHDGSTAMTCRFVTTRVVCENTLNAALRERGVTHQVAVRHTPNVRERVEEARRVLGISLKYFDVFGQRCQAMSAKQLNQKLLEAYFRAVIPLQAEGESEPSDHAKKVHEALAYLFEEGRGNRLRPVRGTLWAAYNAVTEYVDHMRGFTRNGNLRANWEESALFGAGAEIKQRAHAAAMVFLKEGGLGGFWKRLRERPLSRNER